MDLEDATEAIYQEFVDSWSVGDGTYVFDNDAFTPGSATWLRVSVRPGEHTQETLGAEGSRRFRQIGLAIIEVFVPINTGTREFRRVQELARGVFAGKSLGDGLKFFGGVPTRDRLPEAKWLSAVVSATFEYWEQR